MVERQQTGTGRAETDQRATRRTVPSPFPKAPLTVRQQVPPGGNDAPASEEGGLYIISVAARLLEMHPQTLRKYERVGLIAPSRTMGMLRLYSAEDIVRLRLIKHWVEDLGLNLAGVELGLKLVERLIRMEQDLGTIQDHAELRTRVQRSLRETMDLLGLAALQGDQPAQRTVRVRIRTSDR